MNEQLSFFCFRIPRAYHDTWHCILWGTKQCLYSFIGTLFTQILRSRPHFPSFIDENINLRESRHLLWDKRLFGREAGMPPPFYHDVLRKEMGAVWIFLRRNKTIEFLEGTLAVGDKRYQDGKIPGRRKRRAIWLMSVQFWQWATRLNFHDKEPILQITNLRLRKVKWLAQTYKASIW